MYEKIGRTYLFDLDGYHIAHPPEGLKDLDPRAHELATIVKSRADTYAINELMKTEKIQHPDEAALIDENDYEFSYSAYSGESKGLTWHG